VPLYILFFVDNSLLISQEKSYDLSFSFLFCSYNIMSKILLDFGLVIEHSKFEVFYFMRSHYPPNSFINLTSVSGPILTPKPIWQYLGFFFNRKLTFHYHVYFYTTKCLSTLNAIVINFIWPYLHQFFDDSHCLNGTQKPLKRPFDQYQSCFEVINIG